MTWRRDGNNYDSRTPSISFIRANIRPAIIQIMITREVGEGDTSDQYKVNVKRLPVTKTWTSTTSPTLPVALERRILSKRSRNLTCDDCQTWYCDLSWLLDLRLVNFRLGLNETVTDWRLVMTLRLENYAECESETRHDYQTWDSWWLWDLRLVQTVTREGCQTWDSRWVK